MAGSSSLAGSGTQQGGLSLSSPSEPVAEQLARIPLDAKPTLPPQLDLPRIPAAILAGCRPPAMPLVEACASTQEPQLLPQPDASEQIVPNATCLLALPAGDTAPLTTETSPVSALRHDEGAEAMPLLSEAVSTELLAQLAAVDAASQLRAAELRPLGPPSWGPVGRRNLVGTVAAVKAMELPCAMPQPAEPPPASLPSSVAASPPSAAADTQPLSPKLFPAVPAPQQAFMPPRRSQLVLPLQSLIAAEPTAAAPVMHPMEAAKPAAPISEPTSPVAVARPVVLGPGPYRLVEDVMVTENLSMQSKDICELHKGMIVTVLEVVVVGDEDRIRARVSDATGWISILSTNNGFQWAVPQVAVDSALEATATSANSTPTAASWPSSHSSPESVKTAMPELAELSTDSTASAQSGLSLQSISEPGVSHPTPARILSSAPPSPGVAPAAGPAMVLHQSPAGAPLRNVPASQVPPPGATTGVPPTAAPPAGSSQTGFQSTLPSTYNAPVKRLGELLGDTVVVEQAVASGLMVLHVLIAFVALGEQAVRMGIDYARLGLGWNHPMTRMQYRLATHSSILAPASRQRAEQSRVQLKEALLRVAAGDDGEDAVRKLFLKEIGMDPHSPSSLQASFQGVAAALEAELLLPLRALKEGERFMHKTHCGSPLPPEKIAEVVQAIVAAVLSHPGGFPAWRYGNPVGLRQLEGLTERQIGMWREPTSVSHQCGLRTHEDSASELGLFWATKIGGPSHGFDFEAQCLLPLLANARHKVILISDPVYPGHPCGRAHWRFLWTGNSDGSANLSPEPRLWLEAVNVDFDAARVVDTTNYVAAVLRHVMTKSEAMEVPVLFDTKLTDFANQIGHSFGAGGRVFRTTECLELRPSNGVCEASDYLSQKHDWLQLDTEVTAPLPRGMYVPSMLCQVFQGRVQREPSSPK